MMNTLAPFIFSLVATAAFAIIMRVPTNRIPMCAILGGMSWVAYLITTAALESPTAGCFVGASVVGLLGALCAKIFKDAATVFIVPGIIILVPGAKIYFAMDAMLNHQIYKFMETLIQTVMMAGAIAMGILVSGTVIALIRTAVKKTWKLKDYF